MLKKSFYHDFKLELFYSFKDYLYFFLFIFLIFSINIAFKYYKFQDFTSHDFIYIEAKVLNQYSKGKYEVLKLQTDSTPAFYTTSYQKIDDFNGKDISLVLNTRKIEFIDFIKGFYAPSMQIEAINKKISSKQKVANHIKDMHQNTKMKEFFCAIFLGSPISKELRDDVQRLGVSHLIAISGFHIGILSFIVFLLLYLVYKPIHKKFFLYRNINLDVLIAVILVIFAYILLLGFIPSLVRAFAMFVFGFILYVRNIKILSFETLFVVGIFLLALFPELFFSLGFWYSISGVFYIYLFLHYFIHLNKWLILILINIWIYILMMPIILFTFNTFYMTQLLSPIFSLLFNIFYPLSILTHIVGIGGIFDKYLLNLFNISSDAIDVVKYIWFLYYYICVSLLSIYKKEFLYLLFASNITFIISTLITQN